MDESCLCEDKLPQNERQQSFYNGLESDSGKWSSIDSLVKGPDSIVQIDEYGCSESNDKLGCTCFLSNLLHSLFICGHSRHNTESASAPPLLDLPAAEVGHNKSADKALLSEALQGTSLLNDFVEDSLISKLKIYIEQIHYPKTSVPIFGSSEDSSSLPKQSLSLPSAQVWTATHLLKLLCDKYDSVHCKVDSKDVEDLDANGNPVLNLNRFRRLFVSLCWEMESAKKTGHQFYTEFEEFSSSISTILKELRVLIKASSLKSTGSGINEQLILQDNSLAINTKQKQRERSPLLVLHTDPSLNIKSPLTFSIVSRTENEFTNNNGIALPRDFSKLSSTSNEKIITDLLKTAIKSVENMSNMLSSSTKRIASKGLIKQCSSTGKPITCHSTLKKVKGIVGKLLASKRSLLSLEECEQGQLIANISCLFQRWNQYLRCGQCLILKFYELCDMIAICYCFAVHYIGMQIPEWGRLQKEVDLGVVAHTRKLFGSCQCHCGMAKLKGYVISNLIEEFNKKMLLKEEESATRTTGLKRKNDEYFHQQLLQTWYHIVLQQDPIVLENLLGKYEIIVSATPHMEKVDCDMILIPEDNPLPFRNREEKPNVIISQPIIFETFKLSS